MLKNNLKVLSVLSVLSVCLVPVSSYAASQKDAKNVAVTAKKEVTQEVNKAKTVSKNGTQVAQKEVKSVTSNAADAKKGVKQETQEVTKTQKKKGWFSWLGF